MSLFERPTLETQATLLLVDDEPNVTAALRRILRNSPYRVLTAQSGEQALSLMEDGPVDLIVADARMPGMDGATLLREVYARWPGCIRIFLTGHNDIDTMIKAINEGKIYRYLGKPWHDAEVLQVIEQSLAYQYAERERLRLQELTHAQNLELQALNENLERRVRERTAELAATAQLLEHANRELERGYVTATEVFSSLINQRLPQSRQTNQQVIHLIQAFCQTQKMPEEEARNLTMAAALYNIGKLTWRDEMIALPADRLSKEQRDSFRDYPRLGQSLLMALDPAQDAAVLIRHHQERWDGAGYPDGLSGDAIPMGARLLKLAVDTIEMEMGMIQARPIPRPDALKLIAQSAGRSYDPTLCKAFIDAVSSLSEDETPLDESILVLSSHALEPGMIMMKKLYSNSGTLLLSDGKILNQRLIERLQELERNGDGAFQFHVRRPAPEELDD